MLDTAFDPVAYMERVRATRAKFFPAQPVNRAQVIAAVEAAARDTKTKQLPKPWVPVFAPWFWDDLDTMTLPTRSRAIKMRVADQYGVAVEDIERPCRKSLIVKARWDAIVQVHQAIPEWSLPRIATCFGYRDHTSILHALRARNVPDRGRHNLLRAAAWPMHQAGKDVYEIAAALGRDNRTIRESLAAAERAHQRGEI
jgi:hypothetical protein